MRILQSGMAKSGNYWIYTIIQQIIAEANLPNNSFIQNHPIYPIAQTWKLSWPEQAAIDVLDIEPSHNVYRISTYFRMPVENIDNYLQQCNHVWTHSKFNAESHVVFPKFDKIVYIIRDPRDVLLSNSRFVTKEYFQSAFNANFANSDDYVEKMLEEIVRDWKKHVGNYLLQQQQHNIYILFYERLLANFAEEFNHLLGYLGVTLDDDAKEQIAKSVTFDAMKSKSPNHLSKGNARQWTTLLTTEQQQRILKQIEPMLSTLNYPIHSSENKLPHFVGNIDHVQKALDYQPPSPIIKRIIKRLFR